MIRNNLKVKVGVYLFLALSIVTVSSAWLFVRHRQQDLQNVVASNVTQIADIVVASTRYAMLMNKRVIAENIIEDIGKQKGIERLRVIAKDGTIVHSNVKSEVDTIVGQKDAPCVLCHLTQQPLKQVSDETRWRISQSSSGHRVLNTMRAIRNEASCSSASCHEHSPDQSVLGIIDIAYSLETIDKTMNEHVMQIIGSAFAFIIFLSVSFSYLLQRMIYVPLKDLEKGADKVSAGQLDHTIPVRSADEFGRVSGAFNHMTDALKQSRSQLEEFIHGLEAKVEARTKELLEARAEVAQGEKLASIGVLAAGIAHELNNPLTGVLTFTSLMRKRAADGSEDAEDLDLVISETKRCASIIRRLLDFAREKVPVRGYFDLNKVIEDTVRFVERPASLQQINITCELDPGLPEVWGDADLLKQVIMNLVVNAQQAIEGSGDITIQSRAHPSTDPDNNSMFVEISIKDTGCGIAPGNLERIFDPFYTSKEVGQGTGLGLSVSYGIVKAHGGKISVESVVGVGTSFRVDIPVTPAGSETEPNRSELKT